MIEVYAYATPNSIKVPIALEELGLDYTLHSVNVKQGEQQQTQFLALNPNAKVPVLVHTDTASSEPLVLSESAAILVYLAERQGQLLPATGEARARVFEQLFFHASAVSPSFGNAGFFTKLASEPQPLAQQRFSGEAERVTRLLDELLAERSFIAGDDYSIADIAHFGWFWRRAFAGVELEAYPNLSRWYAAVEQRPAVQRAITRINALVASA
ncbi:glutathione S-transferase family protein [Gynuella sunshinyii]|uniref:Glutathione S-transferase n=1 Tax=Gynuella sunshinyii YC6258 TaxID=1445510 RepID=A0A0C5VIK4_9GAMM|nr:glutathione S-transferase N-terminal domain-containing protein [Gynuella sunshinyii]AJQ94502.1 glutathione S-transferase [Gynuella sunshinyii YC6258]